MASGWPSATGIIKVLACGTPSVDNGLSNYRQVTSVRRCSARMENGWPRLLMVGDSGMSAIGSLVPSSAHGTTSSGLLLAFSPDSSMLAVCQPDMITRLVDPNTGNDWAELRRTGSRNGALRFTPDQTQFVEMAFGDRAAPCIWRMAEIRRELALRGLDWPADVLAVKSPDSNSARVPAPTVVLDPGKLVNQGAALDLITRAAGRKNEVARQLLEQAIELDPESDHAHNQLAWILATGLEALRDPPAAVRLARRAIELKADEASYWNTLGVALYRDGQYSEAVTTLDESLRRGGDASAGFDLIFLALGHAAPWQSIGRFRLLPAGHDVARVAPISIVACLARRAQRILCRSGVPGAVVNRFLCVEISRIRVTGKASASDKSHRYSQTRFRVPSRFHLV